MYVAPDTDVRFLTGVKLDPEHVNTIWWSSLANQTNYFMGKTKYTFTDQTYQRVTKGVMRIGRPVADLYDCNYMMFRNTGFHNKWFYAFIDNVEYINNAVTEIRFTIDPIQTWYFEYNFNHSAYVERQHAVNDAIGTNILPEPLEVGEYVATHNDVGAYSRCFNMNELVYLVAICDTSGSTVDGKLYDRVYGGASLTAFLEGDVNGINTFLAQYIQKPDAVLSIYMMPREFIDPDDGNRWIQTGGTPVPNATFLNRKTFQADALASDPYNPTARLDGYTPRNNKLYTYPYNFWQIDNSEGKTLTLRYEWFPDLQPQMEFFATITNPVSVVGKPARYNWVYSDNNILNNYMSIEMGNFPMCSWNNDSFKAWVAQHSLPLGITGVAPLLSAVMPSSNLIAGAYAVTQAATMLTGGAAATGLSATANILSQAYRAAIASDIYKGQINNGSANISATKKQFYSGRFTVQYNVAREIDDFFDLYGYAYNGITVPNINSRPEWNYVKTVGMTGEGALPSDDSKAIDGYFNSGIRFWNWGDHIGDYSLNNRPT